jgi:hypothetical protein
MFKVALSVQTSDISQTKARQMVSALNTQLRSHFGPAWHIQAKVNLVMGEVDLEHSSFDGVLVVKDVADIDGALGYHDRIIETGRPIGYVFEDICAELGEPVSVTVSHELLEMVLNFHINNYCAGPHPLERKRFVWHWKEACDAVQDQTYTIGKVEVSDFVLPLFFTPEREVNEKVNFLETPGLRSFDCTAGGYLGFFDPKTGRETSYFKSDLGKKRSAIKQKMKQLRRKDKVAAMIKKL